MWREEERWPLESEEVRRRLETERDRLTASREIYQDQEPTRDSRLAREQTGYGNHMADDATQTFEDEKELAIRQHLARHAETEVERALHRMRYGQPTVAARTAARRSTLQRLEAMPWATLCFAASL